MLVPKDSLNVVPISLAFAFAPLKASAAKPKPGAMALPAALKKHW